MGYKANIASNLANQLIRIAVGIATSIVVARVLGPRGQGYAAYAILIFTLLGSYGQLGLNNAVMYFKQRSGHDPRKIFNTNLTGLLLIWLVICAAVLLLRSTGLVLGDYNYVYIIGGLVFVGADFAFSHLHSWFISEERIIASNRYNLTVFFLKSAAIGAFWLLGWLTPLSFFLLSSASMLLNAVLLKLKLGQGFRPELDLGLLRAEFAYGGMLWLGAVFAFLHYRVDQFMIRQLLGVADLGVYTVAVTIAELMFLVPLSINSALLGRLYNTSDASAGRRVMSQTLKLSLYLCAAMAAVGIPLCLLIPVVYGQAYAGAVGSTMILLAGVVFASVAKVSAPYFFTEGKPGFHLAITFCTLLLNAALNWLLIPVWGIAGAALASSVSYFFYGLFYLGLFIFIEKFTPAELFRLGLGDLRELIKWQRN